MKEKTQGGERGGWMKIKASFMTFLREQSPRKKKKKTGMSLVAGKGMRFKEREDMK